MQGWVVRCGCSQSYVRGRKFTSDGHMVSSIGEVIAAEALGLRLRRASNPTVEPGHDAKDENGVQMQSKITAGKRVALSENYG